MRSYSITSAGASFSYYSTDAHAKTVLGETFAPIGWELQASNKQSALKDSDYVILHEVRVSDSMGSISQPGLVSRTNRPMGTSKTDDAATSNYISIPGLIRRYELDNVAPYRYYRLKILSAEGYQNKVKIADFGLRDGNNSYAGFITLR